MNLISNMAANKQAQPIYSVVVGGQAGDGAREAGINFQRLISRLGYNAFASVDYPSLIRGGHNFARISFSEDPVACDYRALDALIALNEETVRFHSSELKKGGVIFCDEKDAENFNGAFALPVASSAAALSAPPITRAAVALGAVCAYFGIDIIELKKVFEEVFKDKAKINIDLSELGYKYFTENYAAGFKLSKIRETRSVVIDGNGAFAEGLIAAGLENYFAYPMTPASSILHYLAKAAKEKNLKVVQPENEIAVINMALGSAYAGSRTATGSSGGGFALMVEAMAMAGITEIPIVVAESQRASTSTGVPTRTGQGDLHFVRHIPGEFPRIVLAPGDAEEAFILASAAMNLAWKHQLPALVLLDKQISENSYTVELPFNKVKVDEVKVAGGAGYKRYQLVEDGVSPIAFPGQKDTVVKVNSYEHDEDGYIAENPQTTKVMVEKRFAKLKGIREDQKRHETIKIYGDMNSKNVVLFWGSVKGALLEAMKSARKSFKAVQVVWLEPVDVNRLLKEIGKAKKIVCVENNFTGQLSEIVREQTGIDIKNKILKYDGMPFEPVDLAGQLDKIF